MMLATLQCTGPRRTCEHRSRWSPRAAAANDGPERSTSRAVDKAPVLRGLHAQSAPRPDSNGKAAVGKTGMELEFLGTSSGIPTLRRNVTSLGLRFPQENWLFDCGEGTQHRLMSSTLTYGRITKIFVTHTHGDHVFGLPGVIASIGAARTYSSNGQSAANQRPLHVYGPPGLYDFVRGALKYSHTVIGFPLFVHELLVAPSGREPPLRREPIELIEVAPIEPGEVPGWREWDARLRAGAQLPLWQVFENSSVTVFAAPLRHKVPCVGYVVEEKPLPGHLSVEKATALGVPIGPAFAQLKNGVTVVTPAGNEVRPEDVIGPPRPGRKLVILGDTADSCALARIGRNADVLVHEATFQNGLLEQAQRAGHSTAGMAGAFAREIGARSLILTHFSSRYVTGKIDAAAAAAAAMAAEGGAFDEEQSGEARAMAEAEESCAVRMLVKEAAAEMGRDGGHVRVTPAFDFMRVAVERKTSEQESPPSQDSAAQREPSEARRGYESAGRALADSSGLPEVASGRSGKRVLRVHKSTAAAGKEQGSTAEVVAGAGELAGDEEVVADGLGAKASRRRRLRVVTLPQLSRVEVAGAKEAAGESE